MQKFLISADVGVRIGALLAIGIGLADAWHFHALGSTLDAAKMVDLVFLVGGFAALGVHLSNGFASGTHDKTPEA